VKEVVYSAYTKYSEKLKREGYRHRPVYLGSKALSDWYLLSEAGIAGKMILNVGCAEPIDELHFAELAQFWVSLDINTDILRVAKDLYLDSAPVSQRQKAVFCAADATTLPFSSASFDIVVSFSAIEHIPEASDRMQVFLEVARIVKPSGYFVVTVPNRWNLPWDRWSTRAMKEGKTDFGYGYNYSPIELKKLLQQAGFEPVEFSSDFRLPYQVLPLKRLDNLFRTGLVYLGERMGYLARRK
jgi:SAM-dependent methyltransferase